MNHLHSILGEYYYHFVLITSSYPHALLCTLLFARGMSRRKYYFLLLFLNILLTFSMFLGLAVLRTRFEGIYSRLLAYFLYNFSLLPLLFICYQESVTNILLNWCAAFATQDAVTRIFTLMLAMAGKNNLETISFFDSFNEMRDWGLFFAIEFALTLMFYLIFQRAKCLDADSETVHRITGLSVFFAVWMMIFHGVSREYMPEDNRIYLLITVTGILFCLLVLLLRNGILLENHYRQEITMTEKLLREERKLYDSAKESIDIVNMRCHDLKHQLDDLSFKLTEEELVRLRSAIEIYDSSVKTGNEVLDVVIYEKQLVFSKEGIRFSFLVDGQLLSSMRTTHIYALFSNALGNALEAVRKVDDPEKRIIDLTVCHNCGSVNITVTNYFNGVINTDFSTTKLDRSGHGLGIRSMKYIAEQCGGTLTTSVSGEIFELNCRIPIPAEGSANLPA